jgi:predicted RNase H-like HicB family nuclease
VQGDPESGRDQERLGDPRMIDLIYSLIIEATDEPDFFGFYSPELEGFAGIGHSVEDCLYQAKWGMKEHIGLLMGRNLPIPPPNEDPTVLIKNAKRVPAAQGAPVEAKSSEPAARQEVC